MANVQQISRDYVFRARSEGVSETTAAAQRLGAGMDSLAGKTDAQSRSSLSAEAAIERQQRAMDASSRSTQQFEALIRSLADSFREAVAVQTEYAQRLDQMDKAARSAAATSRELSAANDNAGAATKSAGTGFIATAESALQLATHMKLAVAAAYLLSPAFRGVANAGVGIALRETVGAIAAVSPAAASASVAIASHLGPALSFLTKFAGPLLAVAVAVKSIEALAVFGEAKFKELNDLASKATGAGIDVDLFQRIKLSAEDAGLAVDKATSTITKFSEAAASKPGGSEIEKKLKELTDAGNMVGADIVYRQATSTADRYRIVVDTITKAMQNGERLAALDLAKTFAPAEVVERLKTSGDALQRMQDAADKVSARRLISPQDIAYAQDLKNRLEDSEKVLRERWFPIQNDLTNVALSFKETQIQINELLSLGAVAATSLFDAIKGIPGALQAAGSSSFWVKVRDTLDQAGLISDRLKGGPGVQSVVGGIIPADSINQLTAGLINRAAVQKAMLEANETAFSVLGDATRKPFDFEAIDHMEKFNTKLKEIAGSAGDAGKSLLQNLKLAELGHQFDAARDALEKSDVGIQEYESRLKQLTTFYQAARDKILNPEEKTSAGGRDFWDRALESLDKHIARLKADAIAIGQNVGVHEQLRAEFALLEAAKQADKGVTDKQIETYTKLRAEMSATDALTAAGIKLEGDDAEAFKKKTEAINAAALALERVKVASDIKREGATLFLNPVDLEIANKLKGLYGDDIPAALASSEAAAMRLNAQLKLTQELATDALKSFLSDVRAGKAPLDAFANALTKISDKLTEKGLDNLVKMMSGGGFGFGGSSANDNVAQQVQQGIAAAQRDALAQAARGSGGGYYGGSPGSNPNLVPYGAPGGGGANYVLGGVAGLGALISSYRSGQATASPTQGAVSGGLSGVLAGAGIGAMLGGPLAPFTALTGALVGGLGGGLLGSIVGFFGGNSAQKKQQEDARQAWRDMAAQVADLENLFTGKPFGDLTSAIRQSRDNLDKAMEAAAKAGDAGAVNRLASEWNAFVDRKRAEFTASFGALLDAFNAGLGDNSPLVQAKANVVALGEKLKGFIADTQQAFGGGDTALGSFGAGAGDAAAQIAQAQDAARQMALAALTGVAPLTDIAKRLLEIRGTALGLQQVLVDLGLSASDAANAISAGLNVAIAKLRTDFLNSLTRDINAATGKGFLNDIGDLVTKFQQMTADATVLGADPSLLTRWLDVSAQKIINDAQLTGQSFDDLIAAFPQLQGAVTAFAAVLTRSAADIAKTQQSFQDQLFVLGQDQTTLAGQLAVFDLQAQRAREDEIAKGGQALADLEALQGAQRLNIVKSFNDKMIADTQRALEEAQNFIQGITRRITEYLDGLRAGSGSTLSPVNRLSAAQGQYDTQFYTAAHAGAGQRDALNGITQYANDLLDAAKSYYGSSAGFQTIFANIQSQLAALPTQISPEQFIVNAITDQTTALSTAIASNNPALIATALQPMFDVLDTNTDNAISFAEMQSALGTTYSAGTLQSIFAKLDANGDGLLTRAELQGVAADSIATNTGTTATSTGATATMLDLLTNSSNRIAGIYANTAGGTGGMLDHLNNIRLSEASNNSILNAISLYDANNNLHLAAIHNDQAAWNTANAVPSFARGGIFAGRGTGTSDSNLARISNGEFIMNAEATRRHLPLLGAMNDNQPIGFVGGDSSAVVGELRALGQKIDRLARMVGGGVEVNADVRDGVTETADEMKDMVKLLKRMVAA